MDSFKIHSRVIADYRGYIESFISIRDEEIRQVDFDKVAEGRSKHLVEAHEGFSQFMDQKLFQVVYPVLPMDVLGIYVLLPDRSKS